ncbi:DeoR-type HTH domain protein [Acididesulfobacillus acetoxydans]|uniref:DeoR-type HTH domain protein n=1 Tax=Acididesulfobacillus acetoxydans TaxID=1561005 RepID=A0A8S0XWA7_9FIRM|nr:DeoR/GlpR family DNA-binding transcription regulator [Acididesulfobacillus acetoxydans]CAA7600907.1 DeoR-type HTH domain protein [Acididesulfobacillus acetoxydans]CEJ08936.1 Transcriptional regulator, GntR [Acididesulfobacillus acetoxydans]
MRIAAQRQKVIMDKIRAGIPINVGEFSRELGVSTMTIRRDLERLEIEGLLTRTHGGAVPLNGSFEEPSFAEKMSQFPEEKMAIAKKASELIEEGDTVLLGAGTTLTALAKLLKNRQNLTIVTNTVNVAMELAQSEGIQLILTGGHIRTKSYALVGPLTERVFREVHAKKVFLGVNSISIEHGLSTPDMTEAYTNAQMIDSADKLIVLADHSKFGQGALSRFADIADIDTLITDNRTPLHFLEQARKRSVNVIIVNPGEPS